MASTNALLDQPGHYQSKVVSVNKINVMPLSLQWLSSKIIEVTVGPDGESKMHVHEGILLTSPGLKKKYLGASNKKKGKSTAQLTIQSWEAKHTGRLFQFLYHRELDVEDLHALKVEEQSRELEKLYELAARYEVRPMQAQVLRYIEQFEIATKIDSISFLKMADRLYEYDIHPHLRQYFQRVAPGVLHKIAGGDPSALVALDDMVSNGGDLAQDLFHAYGKAKQPFGPVDEPQVNMKCEEDGSDRHPGYQQLGIDVSNHTPSQTVSDATPVTGRIPWDDQNSIPTDIFSASAADRMLLALAGLKKPWDEIKEAFERATGHKVSPKDLAYRHKRLQVNILDITPDDIERMTKAKVEVESLFTKEKWAVIAQFIVEKGGNFYPPARLEQLFGAYEAKMQAEKGQEGAATNKVALRDDMHEIEAVNGVKARNILPINPKPRKKLPGRGRHPSQADLTFSTHTRKKAITPSKRRVSEVDSETESNIATPDRKHITRKARRGTSGKTAAPDEGSIVVVFDDEQDRAFSIISDGTEH